MLMNREQIQSLYEAFGRGDAGTVLGAFDPEIIWNEAENSTYADRNPYVGPQQVGEGVFGRIGAEWEGFTVTPETILQDGDVVVALGRYRGTFMATGRRLDAQFVHVWTLRGERITRFQQYTDTAQYARVTEHVAK
ncbi:MAG: nuclear transport factor 2 family protein [Gemmatimonadaceae bacterium]